MLDFYLIVSDYAEAYGGGWLAPANRLIPPNVFPFEHCGLAAKYAVLSEADFRRDCGPDARTVSVWARFAQPSRLAWASDQTAMSRIAQSVALAAPTLLSLADPMCGADAPQPLEVWRRGFELTYGCELRAERAHRPGSIVDHDPARYARFSNAIGEPECVTAEQAVREWRRLRRAGKWMSVLRLAKASFTFAGGIDYLAWKINRHAGTSIAIKPWQRRWPLLGALTLLPRLLRGGAIR
jgi:hypothetical protein